MVARDDMASLIVGVDGGGTGCRARVYGSDGSTLSQAKSDAASNIQTGGQSAIQNVLETVESALKSAGYAPAAESRPFVGLGLAGVSPESKSAFAAANPPYSAYRIISDAHSAALGAHDGADGGVAIMGTGAAACVVIGGKARVISGWGFRVDDLGSGADIGRRALRAAMRAHDGTDPPNDFSVAVLERFDGDVWRAADWAPHATPKEYAAFALVVFELAGKGDVIAIGILDRAAAELERLIRLCREHGAERISLLGSIANALEPRLPVEMREVISPSLGDAMDGAALAIRAEIEA